MIRLLNFLALVSSIEITDNISAKLGDVIITRILDYNNSFISVADSFENVYSSLQVDFPAVKKFAATNNNDIINITRTTNTKKPKQPIEP